MAPQIMNAMGCVWRSSGAQGISFSRRCCSPGYCWHLSASRFPWRPVSKVLCCQELGSSQSGVPPWVTPKYWVVKTSQWEVCMLQMIAPLCGYSDWVCAHKIGWEKGVKRRVCKVNFCNFSSIDAWQCRGVPKVGVPPNRPSHGWPFEYWTYGDLGNVGFPLF